MMTLKELEETVDEVHENYSHQQKNVHQDMLGSLHSTQSISGRQSLLTQDHVQYKSASDALSAYIDSFEDSHPLQTTVYQRTVEDLLIPKSILSRTVNRSLETGKSDTKDELHLHHSRCIIDESFNAILHNDVEKQEAEVLLESQILARDIYSDVSSLPEPSSIIHAQLSPLQKSTPLTRTATRNPSSPLVRGLDSKTDRMDHSIQMLSPSTSRRERDIKYDLKKGRHKVPCRINTLPKSVKLGSSTSPKMGVLGPGVTTPLDLNSSIVSGGRPPPSWVDDLEITDVTSVSINWLSSLNIHDGDNSNEPREKREHIGDVGSVSSYGVDEIAILREVEDMVQKRKKDRMIKQAEEMRMRRRWLEDRRNESMLERPIGGKSRQRIAESVTTDDLIRASPYGLGRPLNKINVDEYKLRDLHHHHHPGYLFSKRDRMTEQKAQLPWKLASPALNSAKNATSRRKTPLHSGHRFSQQRTRLQDSVDVTKRSRVAFSSVIPHTTSPTGTESLLHASPLGRRDINYSKNCNTATDNNTLDDNRFFEHLADSYSEGSLSLGSTGDTSRVDAVVQRAYRLMDRATGGHQVSSPDRKRLPARYQPDLASSGSIINRYLGDCLETSKEMSDNIRPLESLKQILFTLQDLEDTHQTGTTTQTDEDTERLVETDDMQKTEHDSTVNSAVSYEPGAHSMKRAMAHLSRLKLLIGEDDQKLQESVT